MWKMLWFEVVRGHSRVTENSVVR